MKNHPAKTVPLGELILVVFDNAATYSADPREVSHLATQAVARMLGRTQHLSISRPLPNAALLQEMASIRPRARKLQASATAPT